MFFSCAIGDCQRSRFKGNIIQLGALAAVMFVGGGVIINVCDIDIRVLLYDALVRYSTYSFGILI
jgi:hypothetical protein